MKEFLKCYQCADASDDRWALLLGTRSPDGRKGTDLPVNPARHLQALAPPHRAGTARLMPAWHRALTGTPTAASRSASGRTHVVVLAKTGAHHARRADPVDPQGITGGGW